MQDARRSARPRRAACCRALDAHAARRPRSPRRRPIFRGLARHLEGGREPVNGTSGATPSTRSSGPARPSTGARLSKATSPDRPVTVPAGLVKSRPLMVTSPLLVDPSGDQSKRAGERARPAAGRADRRRPAARAGRLQAALGEGQLAGVDHRRRRPRRPRAWPRRPAQGLPRPIARR